MPRVTTVIHPEQVIGVNHPTIERDLATDRISEVVITTPYFLYTATMTRDPAPPHHLTSVDISVEDLP